MFEQTEGPRKQEVSPSEPPRRRAFPGVRDSVFVIAALSFCCADWCCVAFSGPDANRRGRLGGSEHPEHDRR